MAFDIDLTSRESACEPVDGILKPYLMKRNVDFTVAANQVANGKIMALFKVPAFVLVEEVYYDVLTAEANVTDIDIGSFTTAGVGVAATGFMEAKSLAAQGLIRTLAGKTYSRQDGTAGYFSQTPWVIGLTNDDADTIATAIIDFFAVCVNLG